MIGDNVAFTDDFAEAVDVYMEAMEKEKGEPSLTIFTKNGIKLEPSAPTMKQIFTKKLGDA